MEKELELALLSGNEPAGLTFRFAIQDATQVGEARRFVARICAQLGFCERDASRAAIVITELGTNLVRYSQGGEFLIRKICDGLERGVEILSVDRGPGISNVERSLTDGFSTGSTPGTGLGAVRRQSDVFDIFSRMECGTLIVAQVYAAREPRNFQMGVICIPYQGETVSGDAWAVAGQGSFISATLADGLGHGLHANAAAAAAIASFDKDPFAASDQIILRMHQNLKSLRGAAVFSAIIDLAAQETRYCGVGNVRGLITRVGSAKILASQNGTAGVQLRATRTFAEPWANRSILILHSDGISNRAHLQAQRGIESHHPSLIAAALYRDFNRGTDDVCVLAVGAAI